MKPHRLAVDLELGVEVAVRAAPELNRASPRLHHRRRQQLVAQHVAKAVGDDHHREDQRPDRQVAQAAPEPPRWPQKKKPSTKTSSTEIEQPRASVSGSRGITQASSPRSCSPFSTNCTESAASRMPKSRVSTRSRCCRAPLDQPADPEQPVGQREHQQHHQVTPIRASDVARVLARRAGSSSRAPRGRRSAASPAGRPRGRVASASVARFSRRSVRRSNSMSTAVRNSSSPPEMRNAGMRDADRGQQRARRRGRRPRAARRRRAIARSATRSRCASVMPWVSATNSGATRSGR